MNLVKIITAMIVFLFLAISVQVRGDYRVLQDQPWQMLYVTNGEYDDVMENVEIAITGQGLVINNIAHVGKMLDTTAGDLGHSRRIYLNAHVLEFCSASLSRQMMEADEKNLVYCPFTIHLYETPELPGQIHVGFRRPWTGEPGPSRDVLLSLDALMQEIITEALSF